MHMFSSRLNTQMWFQKTKTKTKKTIPEPNLRLAAFSEIDQIPATLQKHLGIRNRRGLTRQMPENITGGYHGQEGAYVIYEIQDSFREGVQRLGSGLIGS